MGNCASRRKPKSKPKKQSKPIKTETKVINNVDTKSKLEKVKPKNEEHESTSNPTASKEPTWPSEKSNIYNKNR